MASHLLGPALTIRLRQAEALLSDTSMGRDELAQKRVPLGIGVLHTWSIWGGSDHWAWSAMPRGRSTRFGIGQHNHPVEPPNLASTGPSPDRATKSGVGKAFTRSQQASTQIHRRQGLHPVGPPDLASGSAITRPRQHHARSAEGHAECLLPRAG